eukprot:scaffold3827_cov394-Prasinococcus_capsulatus_cf.AAC.8
MQVRLLAEDKAVAKLRAADERQSRQDVLSQLQGRVEKAGIDWKDNVACKEWYEANEAALEELATGISTDTAMEHALAALE